MLFPSPPFRRAQSILILAFVNSFHLFVEADVGHAGRAGDNGVLKQSAFMAKVYANREAWLGKDGCIAADGGASDGGDILLNPIPGASEPEDEWYNFCHSSTRFFVEETFGRWKSRARFLLYQMDLDHRTASRLIYASMVLHNFFTIHKDSAVSFSEGADEEWSEFFATFTPTACPSCTRAGKLHCTHAARNKAARSTIANARASAQRDAIKAALWANVCADDGDMAVAHRAEMARRATLPTVDP